MNYMDIEYAIKEFCKDQDLVCTARSANINFENGIMLSIKWEFFNSLLIQTMSQLDPPNSAQKIKDSVDAAVSFGKKLKEFLEKLTKEKFISNFED